eukprot:6208200-Pleurochrysis_carterae.AAC.4
MLNAACSIQHHRLASAITVYGRYPDILIGSGESYGRWDKRKQLIPSKSHIYMHDIVVIYEDGETRAMYKYSNQGKFGMPQRPRFNKLYTHL